MTLKEIGGQYLQTAAVFKEKLSVLRRQLKEAETAEERAAIKMEINRISPLYTELRKVGKYCERYYEKGFYINDGPFGGGRGAITGTIKSATYAEANLDNGKRTYTRAEGGGDGGFHKGAKYNGLRKRVWFKCVDDIEKLSQRIQ